MTLSWDASFTLDIPNIHPDIRYCVSIQFVEDVRDMSQMKCEIEETTFVYDFQSKPNGKYNVTVTPVNIVGEGAASSIQFSWRKSKSVALNKNYYYWESEVSPTLGCSIEISGDIYICRYVGMSVVCQITA